MSVRNPYSQYRLRSTAQYSQAMSGSRAREEIAEMLTRHGCEAISFLHDFKTKELILSFRHGERIVELRASAQGWADETLKRMPYNNRMKLSEEEYRRRALQQGWVAVNSILRDWLRSQIEAIETGIFSFDSAF